MVSAIDDKKGTSARMDVNGNKLDEKTKTSDSWADNATTMDEALNVDHLYSEYREILFKMIVKYAPLWYGSLGEITTVKTV